MEFLFVLFLSKPLWMWLAFLAIVVTLMVFDLGVLHKDDHELGVAESLKLSAFYIFIAILFGGYIWWAWANGTLVTSDGTNPVAAYFQGYIIEKVLSIDNVFVISLIFGYFAIPRKYQYRALVWGIIGVIVLRGIMIAIGAELISTYAWVTLVFAAFLALTGIKMLIAAGKSPDLEKNPALKWMRGHLPLTKDYHGNDFTVKIKGKRWYTPLFVVIVLIAVTDLIFAVDSIPAIFAITKDPFIVLTSNVFAVLGLRAMFFLLAGMADRFHLLPYGLAAVLIFIGTKMLLIDVFKIPVLVSLMVVAVIIAATVVLSLMRPASTTTKAG